MIPRLVFRSLGRKPGRSALLLLGYGLGVGVTIALLSIGTALLDQARDRELVGGGDLTVVPRGVDLETLRTSGTGSLGLALQEAPFLYRQVLTGPRFAAEVSAAAPWIDDRLLYLQTGGNEIPISAGGEIPSRSAALGAAPHLTAGSWEDVPADRAWTEPGDSSLYASIDAFHVPPPAARDDSTWAEWHYVNVLFPGRHAVLYLTFMVAGRLPDGRWGGRVLATWQEGSSSRAYVADVPSREVDFSTRRPDLRLGAAGSVRLDSAGRYRILARVPAENGRGELRVRLLLDPVSRSYLPPLDVSSAAFVSGYVAPVLLGRATGRVCADGRCVVPRRVPAYHDHNWGVWRRVTWDWGHADLDSLGVLYGGVRGPSGRAGRRFLYLVDRRGYRGLLPVESLEVRWSGKGPGRRPKHIDLVARSGEDSVELGVAVRSARSTAGAAGGAGEGSQFWQMLGTATLRGRLHGRAVGGSGPGTFETWTRPDVVTRGQPGAPPSRGRPGGRNGISGQAPGTHLEGGTRHGRTAGRDGSGHEAKTTMDVRDVTTSTHHQGRRL